MTAQDYKNNQLRTLKKPIESAKSVVPQQTKSMSQLPILIRGVK